MAEQAFYSVHPKFHAAVDCIIFGFEEGELSLLLLQRNFEPAKGEWSLAGGFVEDGENIDDAARRVVAELTGLDDLYMRQVHTYGEVERDPGERVLSTAYYALVDIKKYDRELVRAHNAFWIKLPAIPRLIFDHNRMVQDALRFMRYQATVKPVGINLLPEEFSPDGLHREDGRHRQDPLPQGRGPVPLQPGEIRRQFQNLTLFTVCILNY